MCAWTSNRVVSYLISVILLQAEPFLKKNNIRELIDPSLAGDFDCRQIKIMLLTASLCIQQSSIRRPSMNQARPLVLLKFQHTNLFTFKFAFLSSNYDMWITVSPCFPSWIYISKNVKPSGKWNFLFDYNKVHHLAIDLLVQVVHLLNGNCSRFTKKSQLPFFRKDFQEEFIDSD